MHRHLIAGLCVLAASSANAEPVKLADAALKLAVTGRTVHLDTPLGIAVPTMYIVNDPRANAATYGTNDDSFIMIHSGLIDHFSDEELQTIAGGEAYYLIEGAAEAATKIGMAELGYIGAGLAAGFYAGQAFGDWLFGQSSGCC